ncbi:hypothetical protein AMST5_01437 [freshwater sediment metagenome]|uniref:Uncharacterized protein n=1 Tax=freshwater sediment metagenome TaxID=556182 RepID=A0AA48LYE4_9ZZZZ
MGLKPFESPSILLEAAKESLRELRVMSQEFLDNCGYDEVKRRDNKTRETVISLRFHSKVSPRLLTTASHTVNDLRHALDHAVCAGACFLGPCDLRGVYFPSARTSVELDSAIRGLSKKIDHELATFLRKFNSYSEGDELLYALNTLAKENKHRHILRISLNSFGMTIGASGRPWRLSPAPGTQLGINKWNDLRNELEFHRFAEGTTGGIDARPALQMVFGDGKAPLNKPAIDVVEALIQKVEGVVKEIEGETARIAHSKEM